MNSADLSNFHRQLLAEGIANSYEYPGYINIVYLGVDVTVGVDADEMRVQIDDSGTEVLNTSDSIMDVSGMTFTDVLPKLKVMLRDAYFAVENHVSNRQNYDS